MRLVADMTIVPGDLICTERYPFGDQAHPVFQGLCVQARAALARHSVVVFPGFLRPDALQRMKREAHALISSAHHMDVVTRLYSECEDEVTNMSHPVRRLRFRTSVRTVGKVAIPEDSALRALYEWEPLRTGVAALLGRGTVYRYADLYGALNISVMTAGDEFGWHFDQTDFVVSLVLQAPQAGGDFQCRPAVRSEHDPNDDAVQAAIEGWDRSVSSVPMREGSLMLFEGRYSVHRVTAIEGDVPRLVALLGYDTKPGTVSSPALLRARYGVDEAQADRQASSGARR